MAIDFKQTKLHSELEEINRGFLIYALTHGRLLAIYIKYLNFVQLVDILNLCSQLLFTAHGLSFKSRMYSCLCTQYETNEQEGRVEMVHTIGQLLQVKGGQIWSIEPQATVYRALQIMAEKNVGALLVIDKEQLIGIFSERDYARNIILKGKSSKDTPVSDLMTPEVFYINNSATVEEGMALMTAKHIRHLPVLENKQLVGIVTLGDVVQQIIAEQKFTIRELEKYITGGYDK
jgi:signal-transduction protein with cAMP-binding, CBS, and nucleotidyltransferase domain